MMARLRREQKEKASSKVALVAKASTGIAL
jgi:hypothetical protein